MIFRIKGKYADNRKYITLQEIHEISVCGIEKKYLGALAMHDGAPTRLNITGSYDCIEDAVKEFEENIATDDFIKIYPNYYNDEFRYIKVNDLKNITIKRRNKPDGKPGFCFTAEHKDMFGRTDITKLTKEYDTEKECLNAFLSIFIKHLDKNTIKALENEIQAKKEG